LPVPRPEVERGRGLGGWRLTQLIPPSHGRAPLPGPLTWETERRFNFQTSSCLTRPWLARAGRCITCLGEEESALNSANLAGEGVWFGLARSHRCDHPAGPWRMGGVMADYTVTKVRMESSDQAGKHEHIEGVCTENGTHYTRKQVVDSL